MTNLKRLIYAIVAAVVALVLDVGHHDHLEALQPGPPGHCQPAGRDEGCRLAADHGADDSHV